MARKVILSVDPGIDDAVALCLALFDPRLDVAAVTAVGGNVTGAQATKNIQALVGLLDPPRWPRLGAAIPPDRNLFVQKRDLCGDDGLGNAALPMAELHNLRAADRVIIEEVRASSDPVTILSLGPLTTLAAALVKAPDLESKISRLVIMGGAVRCGGNIRPAAEFNIFCDPGAAREVFKLPVAKTLIPLDVTTQVMLSFELLDQLPPATTRVGGLVRKMLTFLFRAYRENLGLEGIYLHDVVAMAAVAQPELFATEEMAGDVEVSGELTTGATVFDLRPNRHWGRNLEVAMSVDAVAVRDYIVRGLRAAADAEGM